MGEGDEDEGTAGQPGPPLGLEDDAEEALGLLEVEDEEGRGDAEEDQGDETAECGQRVADLEGAQHAERKQHGQTRSDPLGDEVGRDGPVPWHLVLRVVGDLLLDHGAAWVAPPPVVMGPPAGSPWGCPMRMPPVPTKSRCTACVRP